MFYQGVGKYLPWLWLGAASVPIQAVRLSFTRPENDRSNYEPNFIAVYAELKHLASNEITRGLRVTGRNEIMRLYNGPTSTRTTQNRAS